MKTNREKEQAAFDEAILYFCGTKYFAEKMNVSQSTIRRWRKNGVPDDIPRAIERATGGKIKADPLRLDLEFHRGRNGVIFESVGWTKRSAIQGGAES